MARVRYKRNIDKIGQEKYDFFYKREIGIYKYLSCYRMSRTSKKSLPNEVRFDSYRKWKGYITDKYSNMDVDNLEEFSRYLNLRKRRTKADYAYWELVIPILLTILLTNMVNMLAGFKLGNINIENTLVRIVTVVIILNIVVLVVAVFIVIPVTILMDKIIKPFLDAEINKNFWKDYKEIIDEMIKSYHIKDV